MDSDQQMLNWLREKYCENAHKQTSFVLTKHKHDDIVRQIQTNSFPNANVKYHVLKTKKYKVLSDNTLPGFSGPRLAVGDVSIYTYNWN